MLEELKSNMESSPSYSASEIAELGCKANCTVEKGEVSQEKNVRGKLKQRAAGGGGGQRKEGDKSD